MAVNGLTTLLVARLEHQDAIARLNLLKLIKVIFLAHVQRNIVHCSYAAYNIELFLTIIAFCFVFNPQAVYEHHPRPKQLIVENDLPQKLQNLIEERRDGQRSGGQVLVKQMATALLKALHINTVL